MPESSSSQLPTDPAQTVGRAIQGLAAARLGRTFLPLALLFLIGLGQMLTTEGGLTLAAGAPLAAGAMLAYGLRAVHMAFGRAPRPWTTLAGGGGVIPPAFGIWVLGWLGLRSAAEAEGPVGVTAGLVLAALGVWVLRGWVQIRELHRLAETMALGLSDDTGEPS